MSMRFLATCLPLLLLAGCDTAPSPSGATPSNDRPATAPEQPSAAYDYRYAYRLPASHIEAVQESHARGCDQLGPARCRITAVRYNRDDQNNVTALMTLRIDPGLARPFAKAASATVAASGGALLKADVAGADANAAGRSGAVLGHLRDALANAEAQARARPGDAALTARAERLRTTIATVGELDQGGGGLATTPMMLSYASGGSIPGVGAAADASFETAGATFMTSLAGLAVILAGVGPWALLLILGALALRWLLHERDEGVAAAPELPPAPQESAEGRNVVQRWFGRENQHEPEHAD
jgi:hypothetical protein